MRREKETQPKLLWIICMPFDELQRNRSITWRGRVDGCKVDYMHFKWTDQSLISYTCVLREVDLRTQSFCDEHHNIKFVQINSNQIKWV